MKFALMSYEYTLNLGNEIQSIAARRFLPKIDYYIDHEKLNEFNHDKNVKMIMNGWFLDCLKAWPPSENINPLLVSMHFNPKPKNQEVILSDESREYFKKNGPVGCRDTFTQNFLNENDIDAYFSGCLTLTLDSGNKFNQKDGKNEYVLVSLDNPDKILSFLKDKTDKKIYSINQEFLPSFENAYLGKISKNLFNYSTFYNFDEKMFIAENLLRLYENASCIITDRLHCALPSLALKTPVLLFNSRQNQQRFEGLNNLVNTTTVEDYIGNYNIFDVDNPPENSKEYLKIRKNLIDRCKKFTGHINESCFTDISYNEMVDKNTLLLSDQSREARKYIKSVLKLSKENRNIIAQKDNEIAKLKKQIKDNERIISEYKNSTSWKITSPFRKIRR